MSWRRRISLFGGSLQGRLALLFAIILLPPTAVSLYMAWDSFAEHKERARVTVRQFATLAATYERKFFDDTRLVLERLANDPAIQTQRKGECRDVLARTIEATRELAQLALYDLDGRLLCGTEFSQEDVSGRDWFHDVVYYRRFGLSDYTFTTGSRFPVIVASLAVYDEKGVAQGVLSASIELHWLTAFLRDAHVPGDSVFFLLDSNGNVLASHALLFDNSNPALPKKASAEGRNTLTSVVKEEIIENIVRRRLTDFEAEGNDDISRVYSSVALPHGNVTVLFGVPTSTTFGWIEKDLIARVVSLGAIWIVGIWGAWLCARHLVTRWTKAVRHMALAYSAGDYSAKLDFSGAPNELRDLGDTLMLMATRIEDRQDDLRQSIAQKDILLKEIHHRVKNNLQIVTSLLNIYGKNVREPMARAALVEIKTRVRALAIVHRYLYEGDDVRFVELRRFVSELCEALVATLSSANRRISLEIDVPEIEILSDRAIPMTLLLTEAITNAHKHAFPDERSGRISVRIRVEDRGAAVLTVADDGIGLPVGFDAGSSAGLGFQLIEAFARQLDGEIGISGPGTVIRVRFAMGESEGRRPGRSGSRRNPRSDFAAARGGVEPGERDRRERAEPAA